MISKNESILCVSVSVTLVGIEKQKPVNGFLGTQRVSIDDFRIDYNDFVINCWEILLLAAFYWKVCVAVVARFFGELRLGK